MGSVVTVIEKLIVRGRSVLRMHGAAEDNVDGIPDGTLRLYNDGTSAYIQVFSRATGAWHRFDDSAAAAALYAPIGAAYITNGTNATLTAEVNGAALVSAGNADSLHSHAHSATTGKTANDHHNESHTVASHSDTSATGAQLNTLVGGGSTTLHSHIAGMGTLVHSSNTPASTSATTEADILDITGLSISATHSIRIELATRLDNNSAGARTSSIGLHLNGGSVMTAVSAAGLANSAGQDTSGSLTIDIPGRSTNYTGGGYYQSVDGTAFTSVVGAITNSALPTATITSITIRGLVNGADAINYINHIRVWELPD